MVPAAAVGPRVYPPPRYGSSVTEYYLAVWQLQLPFPVYKSSDTPTLQPSAIAGLTICCPPVWCTMPPGRLGKQLRLGSCRGTRLARRVRMRLHSGMGQDRDHQRDRARKSRHERMAQAQDSFSDTSTAAAWLCHQPTSSACSAYALQAYF